MVWRTTGGQQTGGFANLLSALKSPIYQGFQGLADKADNRVVKFVFLSAEKGVRRTTTRLADNKFSREFVVRLLSAKGICCPPERIPIGDGYVLLQRNWFDVSPCAVV